MHVRAEDKVDDPEEGKKGENNWKTPTSVLLKKKSCRYYVIENRSKLSNNPLTNSTFNYVKNCQCSLGEITWSNWESLLIKNGHAWGEFFVVSLSLTMMFYSNFIQFNARKRVDWIRMVKWRDFIEWFFKNEKLFKRFSCLECLPFSHACKCSCALKIQLRLFSIDRSTKKNLMKFGKRVA